MRKHLYDDEHNKHLDQHRPELRLQEFNSFYVKNGKLVKYSISRTYFTDGGYSDTTTTSVITDAE